MAAKKEEINRQVEEEIKQIKAEKQRVILYRKKRDGMVGIIGAMDEEIERLHEIINYTDLFHFAKMDFYMGSINGKEVVVVRSGIGKVNAAICTQILIDQFRVTSIINTGIAGSLKNEIDIGDIVISSDAVHHDVDATNFGYVPGQVPRVDTLAFPADKGLIELASTCCRRVNPDINVHVGRVASGDQFIADKKTKNRIIKNFSAYCTEMEGAAIAQTAYLNDVPFVIIREISDKADDSAKEDYPVFEAKAIKRSINLIVDMIVHFGDI